MSNIIEALSSIQSELKAPKGQYNAFGKYKYRSCEDILEALKPVLAKHKAAVQISDDIVERGGRIYVQATATLHAADDCISNTAYAREDETKKGMDGAQVTGAASSYARKYALNGLFAIDDTKDPDATNDHGKGGANEPVGAVCVECKKTIVDTKKKDGTMWGAYDIRLYSIERFGKSLCPACMRKLTEEAKANEAPNN